MRVGDHFDEGGVRRIDEVYDLRNLRMGKKSGQEGGNKRGEGRGRKGTRERVSNQPSCWQDGGEEGGGMAHAWRPRCAFRFPQNFLEVMN